MSCKCNEHHSSCVCEVLRAIKDLQDEADRDECRGCKDCLAEPLGDLAGVRDTADTRVFTLTLKDGSPFFAFFKPRNSEHSHCNACVSIFFRVEEVFDNCCARLRVLRPMKDDKVVNLTDGCCIDLSKVCEVDDFDKTFNCITVDLNCFCAVQCIKDIDLDICD
ncbi:CotY/CotZ family spore coat protein [Pseudobacillus wudalianchiensis]|uniref:Spore coat protein CotZ n=1 Tax=Pseudobacillus wudalianchiensis TaxID=1743143 RepID=A0A1B9AU72_9BACI|nr:CotY/CotZ family spore coat protein [Bacillus wudalianchiensis]OCA87344.1 spore coat protein CotZ [Bacillus wudalianchiensis]